jgi:hypothetical protein
MQSEAIVCGWLRNLCGLCVWPTRLCSSLVIYAVMKWSVAVYNG